MAVACPHCQKVISIRDPKPGYFKIRCPKCQGKLTLEVAEPVPGDFRLVVSTLAVDDTSRDPLATPGEKLTSAHKPPTPASEPPQRLDEGQSVQSSSDTDSVSHGSLTAIGSIAIGTREILLSLGKLSLSRFFRSETPEGIPKILDGFELQGLLGRGEYWTTYRARQLSTGRFATLKVLNAEWAQAPTFVARLTRDAFLTSQLNHENLARPLEFGESHGFHYFTREFVEGNSLASELQRVGRISPREAAAYILQAARGLRFAHDHHVIHGNLKLENLLLSRQGQIKVCDFGSFDDPTRTPIRARVKSTPIFVEGIGRQTLAISERGEASMSSHLGPEQGGPNPATYECSDIHGLGHALFELINGRPHGESGGSNSSILSDPAPSNLLTFGCGIPGNADAVSSIIVRMLQNSPADRFQSMADVIRALEGYLAIEAANEFVPTQDLIHRIEVAASPLSQSALIALRQRVLLGFISICGSFSILFIWAGRPATSLWILCFCLTTFLTRSLLREISDGSTPPRRFVELLRWGRPSQWLSLAAGLILAGLLLFVLDWWFAVLALIICSIGLAVGFYLGVDRPLASLKAEAISRIEPLLRSLRLLGIRETSIRRFIYGYSGSARESLTELLLGEPPGSDRRDVDLSRGRWVSSRLLAWRRALLDRVDESIQRRKDQVIWSKLQKVEEAGFIAEGMNLVTARRRARKTAEAMVKAAADLRESTRLALLNPDAIVVKPRPLMDVMREAANKPDHVLATASSEDRGSTGIFRLIEVVGGGTARFLLGTCFVCLWLVWGHQNGIFSADEIRANVEKVIEDRDFGSVPGLRFDISKRDTKPLELPALPRAVTSRFNHMGPGVAGLFLIVSSFTPGIGILVFAIPAALVAFFSTSLPVSRIGPLEGPIAGLIIGAFILLLGLVCSRRSR